MLYKSVFYKAYFDSGIFHLIDLQFDKDNVSSFEYVKRRGVNTNFLTWTALRSSISKELHSSFPVDVFDSMNFKHKGKDFDTYSARCKQFYSVLIFGKAEELSSSFETLASELDLSASLQDVFLLPYSVGSETYVWSFQYKILHQILFTDAKLFKIGLSESEKCSFCKSHKEDMYHLSFNCFYVQAFWDRFATWWCDLSRESLNLGLKHVLVDSVSRNDILNYLIILGKLCIWECKTNRKIPNFRTFLHMIEIKQEIERYIAYRNNKLSDFRKRWEVLL